MISAQFLLQILRLTRLYIGVKWYKKCKYSFSAQIQSEQEVLLRKDYKIHVGPSKSKILAFKNTGKDLKSLVFTARTDRQESKIRMYLSKGKDNPLSSDDLHANDGWQNGLVIKLTDSASIKVEDSQQYNLLIESEDDTTVDFRVDLIYSEKFLENGDAFEDFVNYNDSTCYKYFVKSTNQKLRVGIFSYSGNPDIYVNSRRILEKHEDLSLVQPQQQIMFW